MQSLTRLLKQYDYSFPPELIAQKPANPREAARLLVYRRREKKVFYATFKDLEKFLPPRAVLVFNNTKVLPARIPATKERGGRVEFLYIETSGGLLKALSNRKLSVGASLAISRTHRVTVKKSDGRFYYLKPSFPLTKLPAVLERYGKTPLPYYIKNPSPRDSALRKQYQAVFAKRLGSIAAPTASLHFSERLLKELHAQGHEVCFVTLHVGLGTFAPITDENIVQGRLHTEVFSLDAKIARQLNKAKQEGRPIIAVGTTVARTLESVSNAKGRITKLRGETSLFIYPPYQFKFVDGLVTNFHVPRSSLLMLVSAFCSRREVLTLYRNAIRRRRFRLFSFGDGMLLY